MITCKKIKLYPVGDKEEINRVYQFIRDGQYAQYQALNLGMGLLCSTYLKCNRDIKAKEFIEMQKSITNSNQVFKDIEFAKGVDTLSAVTQKIKKDFSTSLKNGLAKGERCITNYKRTFPLITRGRDLKFYANDEEDLYSDNTEVFIKWVNKIVFKVILGNPYKSHELRCTIERIISGEYKVCQSSIQIDGKNIILNLSIDIPYQNKIELDENVVVGVDLGIAIPAVCALNNNNYVRESIGSKDDFLKARTQIQNQLRQERKRLKHVSGGHGRNKKLKSLDRFAKREKNFVNTYNHMVSSRVVKFALKNKAKYINIEDLSDNTFDDRILRNWSYYQLQQFITYKAEREGIVVRKINPYHTSQNCSECGHWEEGQRISQSKFKCKKCGYENNADFNAARNIAMSTEFAISKSA